MSLSPGTRLGHYDVSALIGEGGMGQVWQATDTQLNRQVALKILPDTFAEDPDRLARFQREAQVLASLNHPNIAQIHGIEQDEVEGRRALVLELVEGPTLADRIAQGPIPIDEALPIAKQIAEALEAAHEQGVIHRDLKPANVKVKADGTVKVLDFGLAKAFQPEASDPNMSLSPTMSLTAAATQMGMVIGTAAYMAPEQAKGLPVDKRADVWAFGAVLFEMLTGKKLFEAGDVSEMLASVLIKDPDISSIGSHVPDHIRSVVRHCLVKDPKERLRDIGDVRLAMQGTFETTISTSSEQAVAPQRQLWQRMVPAAMVALVFAAAAGLAVWAFTRPAPARLVRFAMPLADDLTFSGAGRPIVAIAPTGDRVAFTAGGGVWLRPLDQMAATLGSEQAINPFFSADGQWLGFYADNQLKRVSVSGGAPVTLGAADNPWGASWGADDTILFGQRDGIWRVPGTGGTSESVISIEAGEAVHGPQMLPGGDLVLFTLRPAGTASWDASQIVVQSLASGDRTVLIDGGRDARYVKTGHLVYALNGNLLAQAFDLDQRTVRGGAVALVDGVRSANGGTGAAMFSVSDDGTLVYVPGAGADGAARLLWVTADGQEEMLGAPARAYTAVSLSPDGTRAALEIAADEGADVWVSELTRGTLTRITSTPGFDGSPLWSPDGDRVIFASTRNGRPELFSKAADGNGAAQVLATFDEMVGAVQPYAWSPDGTQLLVQLQTADTGLDVGVLSLDGDGTLDMLLQTTADERNPALSPDGRWLAYASTETGGLEVYVQRFPELGDKRQLSVVGTTSHSPRWSDDGRLSLIYLQGGPPREVMRVTAEPAVTADGGETLDFAPPEHLLDYTYYARARGHPYYAISPNDQRLLVIGGDPVDAVTGTQINVVLNWHEELLERVPIP